jgi:hypothetical protein
MADDLLVTTGDGFYYMDGEYHSLQEHLDGVDEVLDNIRTNKDFTYGFTALRSMTSMVQVVGITSAKLLHGMKQIWDAAKIDADFFEYATQDFPLKEVTMRRYIAAWDATLQAPAELVDDLRTRPMKDLVALGSAIKQGFEIDDWEELVEAGNSTEFAQIVREKVRQDAPRKNGMTTYLDEETGDLEVWADGRVFYLGHLDVVSAAANPIIAKAINRIVDNANVVLR